MTDRADWWKMTCGIPAGRPTGSAMLIALVFGAGSLFPVAAGDKAADSGGDLLCVRPSQEQLTELTSALTEARATTAETKARLDRVTSILKDKDFDLAAPSFAAAAEALNDEALTKLRQQDLEYAARVAEWSRRYGGDHLAVLNLRDQMGEIRKSILAKLGGIAESCRSDYEIAKAREESISNALAEAQRLAR